MCLPQFDEHFSFVFQSCLMMIGKQANGEVHTDREKAVHRSSRLHDGRERRFCDIK